MTQTIRTAIVGCGGMAQHHIDQMLQQLDTTSISALCDPNPAALEKTKQKFKQAGLKPLPGRSSLEAMLADFGEALDAAFIITPHAFHHDDRGLYGGRLRRFVGKTNGHQHRPGAQPD